jgi:adenylate cyclase
MIGLDRQYGFGITRIGVHAGRAIVGNVGGKRRFEYTAHGDSVNVAARLESANRVLGTRICMSADSVRDFPYGEFQPVGDLILKGKSEAVSVVTRWNDYSDLDRLNYLDAFAMMKQGDPNCAILLRDLVARRPHDALLKFHLNRTGCIPPGVEIQMSEK